MTTQEIKELTLIESQLTKLGFAEKVEKNLEEN